MGRQNMTSATFPLTLRVNGIEHHVLVGADDTLLDVVRGQLRLYSCRETCGIGVCGSCTVRLDGRAVSACLTMAFTCRDADVQTAEGGSADRPSDRTNRRGKRGESTRRIGPTHESHQC